MSGSIAIMDKCGISSGSSIGIDRDMAVPRRDQYGIKSESMRDQVGIDRDQCSINAGSCRERSGSWLDQGGIIDRMDGGFSLPSPCEPCHHQYARLRRVPVARRGAAGCLPSVELDVAGASTKVPPLAGGWRRWLPRCPWLRALKRFRGEGGAAGCRASTHHHRQSPRVRWRFLLRRRPARRRAPRTYALPRPNL